MAYNFQTNKSYNFQVYPTAVFGTGFNNVLLTGILNYHAALSFGDIDAMQKNALPYLPPGTPNRPEEYEYLLLRPANATPDAKQTILARQWINESTITVVSNAKAIVTIEGVGSADIEDIRSALFQNGFEKIDIRITN